MKFNFKYAGNEISLNVRVLKNVFAQARGLMFRKKSLPLLFIFKNKKTRAIHSFFCKPFIAIWFNGDRIVDVKKVKPWKISIKPLEKFDRLLEVLEGDVTFKSFLDEEKL